MSYKVVVDTNVLVAGLIGGRGPNREILKHCFKGTLSPYVGIKLYTEYTDLLSRRDIQKLCKQTSSTLAEFLDDFASVCHAVDVWFLWRPNLKDEADNHLIELAIASNARYIITNNMADFRNPELKQTGFEVIKPEDLLRIL